MKIQIQIPRLTMPHLKSVVFVLSISNLVDFMHTKLSNEFH